MYTFIYIVHVYAYVYVYVHMNAYVYVSVAILAQSSRVDLVLSAASPQCRDADLRLVGDGQDHHAGRRSIGYHRQRQGQNSGHRGHPAGEATSHFRAAPST